MPEPEPALAYAYVLVRTDIPLAQQIVQVGHACLEAGKRYDWPQTPCNLVVLGLSTVDDLQIAIEHVRLADIQVTLFLEPDNNLGLTAACTEPVTRCVRRVFRRLPLWGSPITSPLARGPPDSPIRS